MHVMLGSCDLLSCAASKSTGMGIPWPVPPISANANANAMAHACVTSIENIPSTIHLRL